MLKNYKVEYSNVEVNLYEPIPINYHNLINTNTWKIYLDCKELVEERKTFITTEIVPIYETIEVEEEEEEVPTPEDTIVDDNNEEEEEENNDDQSNSEEEETPKPTKTVTVQVGEETREVEVVIKTFENRYIEINGSKAPNIISSIRELVLNELMEYDSSDEVNSFLLNDRKVWLDKNTRVGLMNSTSIQKSAGVEISTLWLDTIKLEISCDEVIQLLGALELYALECFNKTAEHKKDILELTTVEEIINYDYTAGYPEKLNINI